MTIGSILIQVFIFCNSKHTTDKVEVCTRAFAWCLDHKYKYEQCEQFYKGKR